MPNHRPITISVPRITLLILGLVFPFLHCGCATVPQPGQKSPAVSLGPVMDLLIVESSYNKVRLVPDPEGAVHALIASLQLKRVVHVLVREAGASEPETILSNVWPSQLDGAYDKAGRLHALIDNIHMIQEGGTWVKSEHTPWEWTEISPSRAGFVAGAPDLVWAFEVKGADIGIPVRMETHGVRAYGIPLFWPWFTTGSRFVLATEDHPDCWNVFGLAGSFDSWPISLTSDPLGRLHVLYYIPFGKAHDLHYASVDIRDLAPNSARLPEGREFKTGGRVLKLQNVAGARLPKIQWGERTPFTIASDPESGAVLIGMDMLIKGEKYTHAIRGPLPMYSVWHAVPAGGNAFHATIGTFYRLLSDLEWSAPLKLSIDDSMWVWGPSWEAEDLVSIGNGKAFASWLAPHGIVGRWITREAASATNISAMISPMWSLRQPGQEDVPDPMRVVIDTPLPDQSPGRRARVLVTDSRNETEFRWSKAPDKPMSRFELYPPIPELVRRLVEAPADRLLTAESEQPSETIECEIAVFNIKTTIQRFHWDVETRLELSLHARGRDRTVSASASESTGWLGPSEDIIGRVVREALRQAGEQIDRTIPELLAPSGG